MQWRKAVTTRKITVRPTTRAHNLAKNPTMNTAVTAHL